MCIETEADLQGLVAAGGVVRRALDAMRAAVRAGITTGELNAIGELIQRSVQASETLQSYALGLWRATAEPAAFGVRLSGIDTASLMLAGASPRGMSLLLRAARVAAWLEGQGPLPAAADAVPGMDAQLRVQDAVAQRLRERRHAQGSLELETFQPRALFEGERVVDIRQQEQNRARQLIEELMIATNTATAHHVWRRRSAASTPPSTAAAKKSP